MRLAILITVAVLAILMIASAVGPYFVPATTYQKVVEDALTANLDARVAIDSFRLRLIPYPGYTIRGFSMVSRDAPFKGMPIVEAKKVIGSFSFGALFGGDIDTDVEARDVNIYLRSQGGRSNIGMMFGMSRSGGGGPPRMEEGRPAAPGALPDAPIESIPAMPAPSIGVPSQGGTDGADLLDDLMITTAHASDGDDDRSVTLEKLSIVRGTLEIMSDRSPAPIAFGGVSIAAENLSLQGGFSAKVKMTGTMEGAGRARASMEGDLIVDDAREEISFRNGRIYFGGSQMAADVTVGYGMDPALIDIHLASPNMGRPSLDPAMAFLGWSVPKFVSWEGALGADVSFKGTRDAGTLALQLDATSARVTLGSGFSKEPGLPFKIQSDIIVRPKSLTIGKGTLSLEGSDIKLSGEVARGGDLKARISASGRGLQLAAMRSLLPWLPDIDSVGEGMVDMTLDGELMDEEGMSAGGSFGAGKIEVAGIELTEVKGTFAKEIDRVELATLKGKFAGGKLSGHGRVTFVAEPSMEFDVVVGEVDAKLIPSLKDAIDARASIVAKARSVGEDRFELLENFTVSGSFVAKEARISGLDAAAGAFSSGTWERIEEDAAIELSSAATAELEGTDDGVSDFKASFEIDDGKISCESVTWKSKLYSAELTGEVGDDGRIEASGAIEVDKAQSANLTASPEAKKKLFNSKGNMVLPVLGSGRISAPKLDLDSERLAAMMEGRVAPKPMLEMAEEEQKEEGARAEGDGIKSLSAPSVDIEKDAPRTVIDAPEVKEKKKRRAKSSSPKRSAPARRTPRRSSRRKAPARRAPPAGPDQPVEDILKVIIGD